MKLCSCFSLVYIRLTDGCYLFISFVISFEGIDADVCLSTTPELLELRFWVTTHEKSACLVHLVKKLLCWTQKWTHLGWKWRIRRMRPDLWTEAAVQNHLGNGQAGGKAIYVNAWLQTLHTPDNMAGCYGGLRGGLLQKEKIWTAVLGYITEKWEKFLILLNSEMKGFGWGKSGIEKWRENTSPVGVW